MLGLGQAIACAPIAAIPPIGAAPATVADLEILDAERYDLVALHAQRYDLVNADSGRYEITILQEPNG